MTELAIDTRAADGVVVVSLAGDIDVATVDEVGDALTRAVTSEPPPRHLCCDLSRVTFLDSTGLSSLVMAWRTGEARGTELVVAGAHGAVRRVLELTGLDTLFPQFSSVEEFEAAVRQGSPR